MCFLRRAAIHHESAVTAGHGPICSHLPQGTCQRAPLWAAGGGQQEKTRGKIQFTQRFPLYFKLFIQGCAGPRRGHRSMELMVHGGEVGPQHKGFVPPVPIAPICSLCLKAANHGKRPQPNGSSLQKTSSRSTETLRYGLKRKGTA